MFFKPSDKTIKDLLVSGHQFIIPRFQRAYSWERRHYSEFLRDIVGNLLVQEGSVTPNPYFLGTMLFIGNFVDADRGPIEVVDGQQRLTTITILFSVLSEIFKSNDQNLLAEHVFKYIMTTDDNGDPIRILKSKSHYPFFAYYIQDFNKTNAVIGNSNNEEESNIKATYEFFLEQLKEDKLRKMLKLRVGSDFVDSISYVDILKAIRDQVLACSFVAITTDSKEQSNRIFEILNAKGKRLDSVDMIKNLLFEVVNDIEPVDKAEDIWMKIRDKIEDPEIGIGVATFYRHFWASTYKKSTSTRLYEDFQALVKPKNKVRYLQFMNEMLEYADYYVQIVNPTLDAFNNRQEYAWLVQSMKDLTDDLNIVQVRVPLMALLAARAKDVVSSRMLKKTIKFLEGFHFSFSVLTAGRANKIESLYSTFAIKLRNSSSKQDSKLIIDQLINGLEPLYPSFDKFREAFVRLTYTKNSVPSNVLTRYALRRLNCYYSNQEIVQSDLTVEHILSESEGADCVRIGNLVLLESKLNAEADNLPYERKKAVYAKSKQDWVISFVKKNPVWDASRFSDRAYDMAKDYYEKVLERSIPNDIVCFPDFG